MELRFSRRHIVRKQFPLELVRGDLSLLLEACRNRCRPLLVVRPARMRRLGQILNRASLLVAAIEALLLQQMVQRVALVLPVLHGLFHAFDRLIKQSGCTADIHARGLRRRHEARHWPR